VVALELDVLHEVEFLGFLVDVCVRQVGNELCIVHLLQSADLLVEVEILAVFVLVGNLFAQVQQCIRKEFLVFHQFLFILQPLQHPFPEIFSYIFHVVFVS